MPARNVRRADGVLEVHSPARMGESQSMQQSITQVRRKQLFPEVLLRHL